MALRCYATKKPDVVIFSHVNLSRLALMMRPRRSTKVATIVHGIDVWYRQPLLNRFALARANALWSVSSYTRQRMLSLNSVKESKVHLLPNALPAEMASVRTAASGTRNNGTKTILSVSRLDKSEHQKGIDHVIQALPRVLGRVPSVTYRVVGVGSDLPRLRALAHDCGVSDQVYFLGALTDEMLRREYASCDLFALPSSKEGFGMVFLEAMAAGRPVVAARAGATVEIVEHDKTGLLVEYGDVDRLARSVTELLSDSQRATAMGAAGQRLVASRYTFDRYAVQLQYLLSELCPALLAGETARLPAISHSGSTNG